MKQVHWQLPFASRKGEQYRIDIYAEGAPVGGIRQLTGGATPFTTDDDNNDNFFAPVRSQTGCINIIDEDGTLMESGIMPSDNVDKPVRLIRVSDGAVMWQGFLSCETYSQAYTSRPSEVTLNVNSVLEAMGSVNLDTTIEPTPLVRVLLHSILSKMINAGISINRIIYPYDSWMFMCKNVDAGAFIEQREVCNENDVSYELYGLSAQEVLSRLCTYMGWTARESGTYLIFEKAGAGRMVYVTMEALIANVTTQTYIRYQQNMPTASIDMNTMGWMGTGHNKSVSQGAKVVEVVANVPKYDMRVSIPECPVDSDRELYTQIGRQNPGGGQRQSVYMYLLANRNETGDGVKMSLRQLTGEVYFEYGRIRNIASSTLTNVWDNLMPVAKGNSPAAKALMSIDWLRFYAGAFLTKFVIEESEQTAHTTSDGLYCSFFPLIQNQTPYSDPIVRLSSVTRAAFSDGYLNIQTDSTVLNAGAGNVYIQQENLLALRASLQVGDDYWNGSQWVSSPSTFDLVIENGKPINNWDETMGIEKVDGLLIPINYTIAGEVAFCLYPEERPGANNYVTSEVLFGNIDITHIEIDKENISSRSSNHYRKVINANFRDEVTISTDLASYNHNHQSPSFVMDGTTPITTMTYYADDGSTSEKRPEIELLSRLERYYKEKRRKLEIEVSPSDGHLPLVRVTGFDRKTYLPLSESRDWKMGVSTIRCFEVPDPS